MTTVCGKCHDREGTWYMKSLRGNKPIWGGPYILPGTWRKGGGLSIHFCLKTASLGFSDNTLLRFPYVYDWSFPVPPPVPTGKCWPSQGFRSIFSGWSPSFPWLQMAPECWWLPHAALSVGFGLIYLLAQLHWHVSAASPNSYAKMWTLPSSLQPAPPTDFSCSGKMITIHPVAWARNLWVILNTSFPLPPTPNISPSVLMYFQKLSQIHLLLFIPPVWSKPLWISPLTSGYF